MVDEKTFVRPIYAGNALETVKFVGSGPVVVTVRATAFGSEGLETGAGEAATVEALGEEVGLLEEEGRARAPHERSRAFQPRSFAHHVIEEKDLRLVLDLICDRFGLPKP